MTKTIMELVKEGKILEEYGKDYFLTVTPVPNIGRIRFSVIKIGDKGKNALDFYLTTEKMILLCEDILSVDHIAERKFAADIKSTYPSAYKYNTGANGAKQLDIGGGNYGIRVHIGIPKGNNVEHRNMACSFDSFRVMALLFTYIYGLKPCDYYIRNVVDSFWEYNKNNSFVPSLDEDDTTNDSPIIEKNTANDSSESKNSKVSTFKPKITTMFATSVPHKTEKGFEFKAKFCTQDNNPGIDEYNVVIRDNADISKKEYSRLVKDTKNSDLVRISFEYEFEKETKTTYLLRFADPTAA